MRRAALMTLLLGFGAAAQEQVITRGEFTGNAGRLGCRASFEADLATEQEAIRRGRHQPGPGLRMVARLETDGIREAAPGLLRFDSQVVMEIWQADAPAAAPPLNTRIERRFRECTINTGFRLERLENVLIPGTSAR